jgi:glycogen(starch) synthase
MLVFNSASHDARVQREAASLMNAGNQVVVIGIRSAGNKQTECVDGCHIIRVPLPRIASWLKSRSGVLAKVETRPNISLCTIFSKMYADLLNIVHVLWMNMAMAKEAIRQRAEIYHAHDLDTLLAGYIAKRWTGRKLVYDFHELFTEQFRNGAKTYLWRSFYSLLERFLVKQTDLRLTVSDSLGIWMIQRRGAKEIITVRNVPSYESNHRIRTSRTEGPLILYHGKFLRDRGIEQLIESAKYLRLGRILLRGDGNFERQLRDLVKQNGVADRVFFLPPAPLMDIVRTASEADVGVIPYIPLCLNNQFCLPNKLFEYMMAGLAVAASDLPELRRIIYTHHNGRLFRPGDPQDMARVLNELLSDDARLEQLKQNSLRAAGSLYNWNKESEKLVKYYHRLTQGSQNPGIQQRTGLR